MKRWMPALMAAVAAGWTAAATAALHPDVDGGAVRVEVLAPNTASRPEPVRLSIVQVFFPGVADRFACRMQVRALNQSTSSVNFSALLKTYDEGKVALDSWLIPTGELAPGQEVLRTYSCRQAASVEISRKSEFGWPTKCEVDGREASPCPIELHVTSSMPLPQPPDKKKSKPE
jgi:hypothetical protein